MRLVLLSFLALLPPLAHAQAPAGFVDISVGPTGVPMVRSARDVAVPAPATDGAPALRRATSDAARGGAAARFQIGLAPAAVSAEAAPGQSLALAVGPNPTRGAATAFVSGPAGEQTVEVLDALGRRVAFETETVAAGRRTVALPAGLAPGVYVVRVGAGAETQTVRLVVVR